MSHEFNFTIDKTINQGFYISKHCQRGQHNKTTVHSTVNDKTNSMQCSLSEPIWPGGCCPRASLPRNSARNSLTTVLRILQLQPPLLACFLPMVLLCLAVASDQWSPCYSVASVEAGVALEAARPRSPCAQQPHLPASHSLEPPQPAACPHTAGPRLQKVR